MKLWMCAFISVATSHIVGLSYGGAENAGLEFDGPNSRTHNYVIHYNCTQKRGTQTLKQTIIKTL